MKLWAIFCIVNSPYYCIVQDLTPKQEGFSCGMGAQVEIIEFQKMHPDHDLKSWSCSNDKKYASN